MSPFLFTRFRRRPVFVCCSVLTSAVFCILLCILSAYTDKQQKEWEQVRDNFPIECVVSNVQGTQTTGLRIPNTYINYLTEETSPLFPYVKDIFFTKELMYQQKTNIENEEESLQQEWLTLEGITEFECVDVLSPKLGGVIAFYHWYQEDFLSEQNAVCLISSKMAQTVPMNKDGRRVLELLVYDPFLKTKGQITLNVAGEYASEDLTIYIPWDYCYKLMLEMNGIVSCDSIRFWVKENQKLPELIAAAEEVFVSVDSSLKTPSYQFALTIHDERYQKTLSALKQNIEQLKHLIPLLLAVALGIGGLISFLGVRHEKKSFALMRSLGVTGKEVFLFAIAEEMLAGGSGGLLGMLLYLIFAPSARQLPLGILALYLFCYLFGCCCAVCHTAKTSPGVLLKEE